MTVMEHLIWDRPGLASELRATIRRQAAEPLTALAWAAACCRAGGMNDEEARGAFDYALVAEGIDACPNSTQTPTSTSRSASTASGPSTPTGPS